MSQSRRTAVALVLSQIALIVGAGWTPVVESALAPSEGRTGEHESAHGGGHDHTHDESGVVVPRRPGRRVRRLDVAALKILI